MLENLMIVAKHHWCSIIEITELAEELQLLVGLEIVLGGAMEVRVVEQSKMEPGFENLDNEAVDAKEDLDLAARKLA
jgi:hypothetical protein